MSAAVPVKVPSVEVCTHRAAVFLAELQKAEDHITREEKWRGFVWTVFAYWASKMGHRKALLDRKREQRILARLRENKGDMSELLYAVDGARKDDWLMGREVRSPRPYDGIETVFRDREQVERLANLSPGYRRDEPHPMLTKVRWTSTP